MTLNVDLRAPIIPNTDPRDIETVNGQPPFAVYEKWRYFSAFYRKIIDITNPDLNTLAGKIKITDKLINEFNTDPEKSSWIKRFGYSSPYRGYNNPVTREDIFAIQRFTKKTDPNIVIDGWLGTQTYQCNYPAIKFTTYLKQSPPDKNGKRTVIPYPPNKLYPVVWGNQRYVITYKDATTILNPDDLSSTNSTPIYPNPLPSYFTLYDPVKHKIDNFVDDFSLRLYLRTDTEWLKLDSPYTPETGANEINKITEQTQTIKEQLQNQTKINNTLNKK